MREEKAGKEAAQWKVLPGEKKKASRRGLSLGTSSSHRAQEQGTEILFPVSPTLLSWNPGSSLHSSPPPNTITSVGAGFRVKWKERASLGEAVGRGATLPTSCKLVVTALSGSAVARHPQSPLHSPGAALLQTEGP